MGIGVEWGVNSGSSGGVVEVGEVAVEGREKGVGGRIEYCVVHGRGPPAMALRGTGWMLPNRA